MHSKYVCFGDSVQMISGKTPSKQNNEYWNGDVPWISASSMDKLYVSSSSEQITTKALKESGIKYIDEGTPLLLVRGSILHQRIPVSIPTKKVTINQDVKALKLKNNDLELDYFIAWLLASEKLFLEKVEFTGIGAGKLDTEVLNKLSIPCPDKITQEFIGSLNKALNQKIELNNQINETLESMAKAIFKEWFIDFGPVKAKAEGKKPFGMDDKTAALFPDSFEESELGMIPKGWSIQTIGESCDLLMGQSPPGDTYNENGNGMVFYQGRAEFGARFPTPRLHCSAPARVVRAGTVLLSVRAPVGDLNISTSEQTCIGRGLAGIMHKIGGTTFTYYLLASLKDQFDMYNGEGTVFGSINKDTLSAIKHIEPSDKVFEKFLEMTRPLDELYLCNFKEINALATTRDLLLPRLISGEIDLKELL